MTKEFDWKASEYATGFKAEMVDNVTLFVTPDQTIGLFGAKPKRGTIWRAGASQWDGKSTISRFGRDEYNVLHKTAKDAMRAAERIYRDALESADA